jgi:hypothetical protein
MVSKLERDEERARDNHFGFNVFSYNMHANFALKVVLKGCGFIC